MSRSATGRKALLLIDEFFEIGDYYE